MIESAFVAKALATAAITTLIGSAPARLYPNAIAQSAIMPAACYQLISDPREEAMGANAGIRHARIQVTCVANTYLGARTLANAFATAFNRYRGTAASVVVQETFVENMGGNIDQTVGLELGVGVSLVTLDLIFHYEG